MGPQCQIDVMPGVKISWYEQERHISEVMKKGAQKVETNHKMIKGFKHLLMNNVCHSFIVNIESLLSRRQVNEPC